MVMPAPYDCDKIVDGLYVGSVPQPKDVSGRFDILVFCAMEVQPSADLGYHVKTIVRVHLDDADPISHDDLEAADQAAKIVAHQVGRGQRVLVTCAMGVNRSCFVAGLALHYLTGKAGWYCIEKIRATRHPASGRKPLQNGAFVRVLESLKPRPRR
jgi:hypothetical protein